jgi:hypothetical protein
MDTLKNSCDFTHETLANLCHHYAVAPINASFALLPRHEYDRLKTAAMDAAPPEKWIIPKNCCLRTADLIHFICIDSVNDCEAGLLLRGGIVSSHYLRYDNGQIYDIGCDGEDVYWLPEEFIQHYQNAWWVVQVAGFHWQ